MNLFKDTLQRSSVCRVDFWLVSFTLVKNIFSQFSVFLSQTRRATALVLTSQHIDTDVYTGTEPLNAFGTKNQNCGFYVCFTPSYIMELVQQPVTQMRRVKTGDKGRLKIKSHRSHLEITTHNLNNLLLTLWVDIA